MRNSPFQLPRKTPFGLIEKTFESITGLKRLNEYYQDRPRGLDTDRFLKYTIDVLNINYSVAQEDIDHIPLSGSTVVVANHPLGGLEGVILAKILRKVRSDVKILANYHLKRIPELKDLFIGVDVFETKSAYQANIKALREAHQHISKGGLLLIFPAGEVSSFDKNGQLNDKTWSLSVAALVRKHDASVLPVFIGGKNSRKFYRAGQIHPLFRTFLLGRELLNKRGKPVTVTIGEPMFKKEYCLFTSDIALVNYFRLNTYLLKHQNEHKTKNEKPAQSPITASQDPLKITKEINSLPQKTKLLVSGSFDVYCVTASQIPLIIKEIGRMREVNFRAVGEGTGLAVDLDKYDDDYQHLFIWDRKENALVGAYRLCHVQHLVQEKGIEALYSRSLFKYDQRFITSLNTSLEMGRSVIDEKYQRSFTALLLLWKGIGEYVWRHPEITTLFGPVSMSTDYPKQARRLLAESLSIHHYDNEIAQLVRPTTPLEVSEPVPWHTSMLSALGDIELLSKVIQRISHGAGLPVLLRQYLGLKGKLVCFNVDPTFNNALDGLIVVDLRNIPPNTLARYMQKDHAKKYLKYHNEKLLYTQDT